MRKTIKNLEEKLNKIYSEHQVLRKENYDLKERLKVIAGENESLRSDKKWLQQMHSAVLQSMHEFVRGRGH